MDKAFQNPTRDNVIFVLEMAYQALRSLHLSGHFKDATLLKAISETLEHLKTLDVEGQ